MANIIGNITKSFILLLSLIFWAVHKNERMDILDDVLRKLNFILGNLLHVETSVKYINTVYIITCFRKNIKCSVNVLGDGVRKIKRKGKTQNNNLSLNTAYVLKSTFVYKKSTDSGVKMGSNSK